MNIDCGDNSCLFAESMGGMRTNGGCRCLRKAGFPEGPPIRSMRQMLQTIAQLRADNAKLVAAIRSASDKLTCEARGDRDCDCWVCELRLVIEGTGR